MKDTLTKKKLSNAIIDVCIIKCNQTTCDKNKKIHRIDDKEHMQTKLN